MRTREELHQALGQPTSEVIIELLCDIRQLLAERLVDVKPTPIPLDGYTIGEIKSILAGKPIEAFKSVRMRSGLSLTDAKNHVDRLRTLLKEG